MTLLDLIVLLIIAGICGALGQAITGFTRGGCLVAIALGFIGALLGMWLARQLGLPELLPVQIGNTSFPVVWSIIGSAIFVAIISLLTRRRPCAAHNFAPRPYPSSSVKLVLSLLLKPIAKASGQGNTYYP